MEPIYRWRVQVRIYQTLWNKLVDFDRVQCGAMLSVWALEHKHQGVLNRVTLFQRGAFMLYAHHIHSTSTTKAYKHAKWLLLKPVFSTTLTTHGVPSVWDALGRKLEWRGGQVSLMWECVTVVFPLGQTCQCGFWWFATWCPSQWKRFRLRETKNKNMQPSPITFNDAL